MISSKSAESQKLVQAVHAVYEAAVSRHSMSPQTLHFVRRKLETELTRIVGTKIDANEMSHWLQFRLVREAPHGLSVELHHEHVFEARANTPDWVYALYWASHPRYGPHFKLWSDDVLPAEGNMVMGECPECGRSLLNVQAVDTESGVVVYACENNHVFNQK